MRVKEGDIIIKITKVGTFEYGAVILNNLLATIKHINNLYPGSASTKDNTIKNITISMKYLDSIGVKYDEWFCNSMWEEDKNGV